MSIRSVLLIGMQGLALILSVPGDASAQWFSRDQSPEKKMSRDRVKMAVDVGGLVLDATTLDPFGAMFDTASLGWHAYQYRKHKQAAEDGTTGSSTVAQPTSAAESLVAVPDRPGYFYYPSNPNQLYIDTSSTANPMQARISKPARIKVQIANATKDGRTIHYTVSGTPYSVPPGYTQILATPAGSVIAFDRGDPANPERFTLAEGSYEFRTVDQGWRFYSTDRPASALAKAGDVTKGACAER